LADPTVRGRPPLNSGVSAHKHMVETVKVNPPAGTIRIDLDEGYRPHFTERFVEAYGPNSLFTLAAADCLTERHVHVLVRAEKLTTDAVPLQLGPSEAFQSLVDLIKAMAARGAERSVILLMQSALGHADARQFEQLVDETLGVGVFDRWNGALENRDFGQAQLILGAH